MTLPDAAVKIISALCVALLGYLLKNLSKFQLFNTFMRLSSAEKSRLFSLLHKSNDGFLNNYKIQSQMLMYGIRYSTQFMKNLFYYAHKNNIRADNKDLSAFLSLPGLFICKDNGEVSLQKGARLLSFFIFVVCSAMMIIVASLLPESLHNLPIYLAQKNYFLLALQATLFLFSISGLILCLVMLYILLFLSIPAFRFAKEYRAAWESRDLFDVGEQNLYCGNKPKG
ncbi:hypothetical protein [Pantoea agglomerans]|uniref:hypothetical protein n=1 Tax=Enterobacter agglomerans TaxID=549 RepID=UPI003C7C20AE